MHMKIQELILRLQSFQKEYPHATVYTNRLQRKVNDGEKGEFVEISVRKVTGVIDDDSKKMKIHID